MTDSARYYIAKALGAFWLLDGLLQFQPAMFGPSFVSQVLKPVLSGQPGFLDTIVDWGIRFWNLNTVASDIAAALLQIAIGLALLLAPPSRTVFKLGLWVSIAWSVVVWLCGEGAGQLLTGTASFYTGAPGSVAVYALLAVLLLMPEKARAEQYPKVAGWLCVLGFLLQLQPSFWTANGVRGDFSGSTDPVRALSALPAQLYNAVGGAPVLSNVLLAFALLAIGLALVLQPNRVIGIVALAFLFFVWWFGQDFGQLSTVAAGTATDPNTAPLVALLLVPIFVDSEFSAKTRIARHAKCLAASAMTAKESPNRQLLSFIFPIETMRGHDGCGRTP